MGYSFYHRGSLGDIIYALPTIISYGGCDCLFLRAQYHTNFLRELLERQPSIKKVELHDRREGLINLSSFAGIALSKPSQHLVVSHLESQNKQDDCLIEWKTQPWLFCIESNNVADIIVNRTGHYHDKQELDWSILGQYKDRCKFVGYRKEWKQFIRAYKIDIGFHPTENALELAQVINGSKLFIGNQSLPFALAEAMKKNRCLEAYCALNNCQPQNQNGHTYLTEDIITRYLET